ncbi:MAG: radical SAM protein [Chloroflexi bacterium]|nr:radical SAM protein [Chloroflexota bacterium]MCC6897027.1 radical SAM protein [Anaerolineae bacterium]
MNIISNPNTLEKLKIASDSTDFEPVGDQPQVEHAPKRLAHDLPCITNVSTPTGAKPVMKTMMTTACERNCYYCPFRAGRGKTQRITFKPDEMAASFDQLQRAKIADGLFLSSGIIKGSVTTQDKILDTVEIIRRRYQYRGYVHLKIMPGAEYDQLYRAMQLADRVSINLEGATEDRLAALAPKKNFNEELLQRLAWAHQIRQSGVRASTVTQFVVGAVGDTDVELLSTSERLYRQMGLTRAYFSAFHPIVDTPFENLPSALPTREFRLYQSSFLLRDYGWNVEELPFEQTGNLRLDIDPKRAWAEAHLTHAPIELMLASREELMRIPGFGPKAAESIMKARRSGHLTELSHLRALGIRAPEQAAPFILLDGHKPAVQLSLF